MSEFGSGMLPPTGAPALKRCFGDGDPLMEAYHDLEWGFPVHDDRRLFEALILDAFQAGLSWRTILHKREAFRQAFDGFDARVIAGYGDAERTRLMATPAIVRNRLKIDAAIANAQIALLLAESFGSLDYYLWGFVGFETLRPRRRRRWGQIPTTSPESDALAADLRARGFRFAGSTICYAFMQSAGMIDDHLADCFRSRTSS